jgi:hypothetical protein
MTKDVGILILGLFVAVMPYLGFTSKIEKPIFVIVGLSIAVLAILIRDNLSLSDNERKEDTFTENGMNHNRDVSDGILRHEETAKEDEGPKSDT